MSNETTLELYFVGKSKPELLRTVFNTASLKRRVVGIRGTDVPIGTNPFRWTTSTHALALFFTKSVLRLSEGDFQMPIVHGFGMCPAATLSRLLTARTDGWLLDIFGHDAAGRTLLAKILLCKNYRLKMPGPIQVFMRGGFLSPEKINIFLDDQNITKDYPSLNNLSASLEQTWTPGVAKDRAQNIIRPDFSRQRRVDAINKITTKIKQAL